VVSVVKWKLLPPPQLISKLFGSITPSAIQWSSKPCVTLPKSPHWMEPPPVIRPGIGVGVGVGVGVGLGVAVGEGQAEAGGANARTKKAAIMTDFLNG
jgi:hypothetical protein